MARRPFHNPIDAWEPRSPARHHGVNAAQSDALKLIFAGDGG